ncbi:DUF6438 domain-containing protein [Flavobacterium humi]|uniref:DUF6438 domain-containing protein n=1 Tax=Flavobacterium humi TaxID=2562683 RepID=A0A4Z0L677_9FLAO|nr:DUF6438 domain-containing protein [Flavobacterium humi]TGD56677.1 hypothetical protein E4635_14640 [Flavobacterium humi]
MKNIFFLLPILFSLISCKEQNQKHIITKTKIDSLKTTIDVERFITSIDTSIKNFKIQKISDFKDRYSKSDFCKSKADSLKIDKSFYTADFDNNGYTDLLTIMDYYDFTVLVIYGNANHNFKIKPLTRRAFQDCVFPKIIEIDGIAAIDLYHENHDWGNKSKNQLVKNTLVYQYGDFVEYNPEITKHVIKKIEFKTTGCFGTCPVFNLVIDQNRAAKFDAQMYNRQKENVKEIKGEFSTEIKEKEFNEIVDLLNYIDFPNLKNEYSVPWTDDQSCTLKITYDNGSTKTIYDYGMIGTYGLDRIYGMLYSLRFNQSWK